MAEDGGICPICVDGDINCTHDGQGSKVRISQMVQKPKRPRVIRQRTPFGKAGYIGDVEIYDPQNPDIRFVNEEKVVSSSNLKPKGKKEKDGGSNSN